jgi:hypothetical protein
MLLQNFKGLFSFTCRALVLASVFLFLSVYANAQTEVQLGNTLQQKLTLYQKAHPSSLLFVHFDKTLYTNNDNVWFTAYLINCNNTRLHNTLSVSLVNDIDHTVVMEEKFVMQSGLGFGNLHLPDTIPPGNYTFMLYTNRKVNNQPEATFTQPITIKTTEAPAFKAILSLSDTSHALYNKPRQVILTVNGNDYLPVANAVVNYKLSGADTAVIEGKAKTDKSGQYIVQVPPGKTMVKVQVNNKKASQYLYLSLPHEDKQAEIMFYPEGGNLINNIPSRVGWEAKVNGQPLQVQALLYEDKKAIDTIATNSYGMGKFVLVPVAGKHYTVKLGGHTQINDPEYNLPVPLTSGVTLTANQALLNDTLNLVLKCSYEGVVYVNIHNYKQHFFTVPVQVKPNIQRKVKILLTDLPRGLAEVTVTDSAGRPYAERLFFAHYDQRNKLDIKTEKAIYNTRQKVTLKLKLNQVNTDSMAVVSVACIQDNRVELKKRNDIESYLYLKNELNSLPLKETYMGSSNTDKQYLEDILLIKGWRKYFWTDLLKASDNSTVSDMSSATFTGKVYVNGKPVKKPVSFILNRDSSNSLISTDATGNFTLTHEQLISAQDKNVRIMPNISKEYEINVTDHFAFLNKQLARQFKPLSFEQPLVSFTSDNLTVKGIEKAIQLRAVTVKPSVNRLLYGALGNECGDYVCSYNILNCGNHLFSLDKRPAKIGETYYSGNTRLLIIYKGCIGGFKDKSLVSLHGIYESKQFYGSDYSVASPSQPEYLSTLFWKHLAKVGTDKETTMTFYTGDITGKFRIIVQGITDNGVVYGESSITVKQP